MTQHEGRTVVTAQGSEYKYLSDGTTRRFKKTEGREYKAQNVLVFIPDYQTLR